MGMVALLALAACSTEEPYNKPFFDFSKGYRSAPNHGPRQQADARWWQEFRDPTLDTLMVRSLDGNLDLALARERVIEAMANVDSVSSPFSATPSAGASVEKRPFGGTVTRGDATLNFGWVLDPYGLRRQQLLVAGARREATKAEVDAARQVLTLNVANAYVDLRYYQKLMDLRHQQLRSRRRAVALTEKLFQGEAATRLDVVRTEALLAETETQIPPVSASILARKNEIAVLTGLVPDRLDVNLSANASQPRPAKSPDLGIPADVLRNRPDIQIAELNYYAAINEVGIARADLYPQLSLTGLISQVLVGGATGTQLVFGPAVDFPSLFNDAGKARVAAAHSRARQAHTTWKATVLSALEEVDSAYAAYQGSLRAVQEAQNYSRLQREARDLTLNLVEREGATVRDLITAEGSVADADVILAESLRQLGRDFVQLNVALGAGSQVGRPSGDPIQTPEDLIQSLSKS